MENPWKKIHSTRSETHTSVLTPILQTFLWVFAMFPDRKTQIKMCEFDTPERVKKFSVLCAFPSIREDLWKEFFLCQFQGETCTRPSNPCCLQLQDENAAKLDRITTSRIGRTARREIKLPWFLFSTWREQIRRAAAMVRLRRSTASANAAAGHHSHTTQRVPATDGFSVCPSVLTLIHTT